MNMRMMNRVVTGADGWALLYLPAPIVTAANAVPKGMPVWIAPKVQRMTSKAAVLAPGKGGYQLTFNASSHCYQVGNSLLSKTPVKLWGRNVPYSPWSLQSKRRRASSPKGFLGIPSKKQCFHPQGSPRILEPSPEGTESFDRPHESEAGHATSLQPSLSVFPNLKETAQHLTNVLSASTDETLRRYRQMIQTKFGDGSLPQLLVSWVDAEILQLQGQVLTAALLQCALRRQSVDNDMFRGAGGYLDAVTDSRDASYLRYYVGQSVVLSRRIQEHHRAIMNGDVGALHYYILALAQGCRRANFIRLFRIEDEDVARRGLGRGDLALLLNMLEMIMALAFRSLPARLCNRFSRGPNVPESATIHLNVLNPLSQGHSELARVNARDMLAGSSDPEIRSWPDFRAKAMEQTRKATVGFPSDKVITDKIVELVSQSNASMIFGEGQGLGVGDSDLDLEEELTNYAKIVTQEADLDSPLEAPIGSLAAPVAIILATASHERIQEPKESKVPDIFPCKLQGTGLTSKTALIWPLDFGAITKLRSNDFSKTSAVYDSLFSLSRRILDASPAKVVLASGSTPQRFISDFAADLGLSQSRRIQLDGLQMTLRLRIKGGVVERLVIDVPDLHYAASGHKKIELQTIACALRIACLLIPLEGIRCHFYRAESLKHEILDLVEMANRGENMPIQGLSTGVLYWLQGKGFETHEEIQELVQLTGKPLGIALHILLLVSQKLGKRQSLAPSQKPTILFNGGKVYSHIVLEDVAELYCRRRQRLQDRLKSPRMTITDSAVTTIQAHLRASVDPEETWRNTQTSTHTATNLADRATPLLQNASPSLERVPMKFDINTSVNQRSPVQTDTDMLYDIDIDAEPETDPISDLEVENASQVVLDVEARDLLIHEQVLKLKEGKVGAVEGTDRRMSPRETLIEKMTRMKKAGHSFEELKEEFLGLSANTIRCVMVKGLKGGRPPGQLRGKARVVEMINNGYIFSQQQMSLLCFRLLWMLEKDIHQGFKYGDEHRVWIEFAASGEVHSSPWFPDASRPDLRTFAFKVGHPKDTKAASLPLNPRIEGAMRNRPTKLTNQALLVKQQTLATEIVRVYKRLREGE